MESISGLLLGLSEGVGIAGTETFLSDAVLSDSTDLRAALGTIRAAVGRSRLMSGLEDFSTVDSQGKLKLGSSSRSLTSLIHTLDYLEFIGTGGFTSTFGPFVSDFSSRASRDLLTGSPGNTPLISSNDPLTGGSVANDSTTPTLSVTAAIGTASEVNPFPGVFRFTRTGDVSQPLTAGYSLGGSASPEDDYLVWENNVTFAIGADTAYVTVLPRNDALQEGNEDITLTLSPGNGYTVGTSSTATVTVQDQQFVPNAPGVFDTQDYPLLAQDIRYLETTISNNQLLIAVGLTNISGLNNVEIFIDADQNPATGDIRAGHVGGAEYRITALAGIISDYQLFRLPTTPSEEEKGEQLIASGGAFINGNNLVIAAPLKQFGDTTAVDVFAVARNRSDASQIAGNGDRAPDYGWLDTTTGQVVVRRPGITQAVTLSDPTGDSGNGFDLVSTTYQAVADQFTVTLEFNQQFDPTQPLISPGPSGEVIVDSDRNLLTGGILLGDQIPTWGGDWRLFFDLTTLAPKFLLQADPSGIPVVFGEDRNDGRWFAQGNKLFLTGSLSVLDTFTLETGKIPARITRIPTDGRMYATASTLFNFVTADTLPEQKGVVDTLTGQLLAPLVWDPNKTTVVADPQEFGFGISGIDLIQVDTQVVEGNLVVKGTLSTWLNTDVDNLFEILLDTDMNAATGEPVNLGPGQPTIGADYSARVISVDAIAPIYVASLLRPDGVITVHESIVRVQTSSVAGQPGSFTITIPLVALGNLGPQLRLFVTTGQQGGVGRLDIAPNSPVVVSLEDNPSNRGQLTSRGQLI